MQWWDTHQSRLGDNAKTALCSRRPSGANDTELVSAEQKLSQSHGHMCTYSSVSPGPPGCLPLRRNTVAMIWSHLSCSCIFSWLPALQQNIKVNRGEKWRGNTGPFVMLHNVRANNRQLLVMLLKRSRAFCGWLSVMEGFSFTNRAEKRYIFWRIQHCCLIIFRKIRVNAVPVKAKNYKTSSVCYKSIKSSSGHSLER